MSWNKVSVSKPVNRTVLIYWINELGNGRTSIGEYVPKYTVEAHDDSFNDFEWADYSEDKDEYYIPEGWYELGWCGDSGYEPIDGEVTHWRLLPRPPERDTRDIDEILADQARGIDG